jgi:glycosyltransferase involved in cell wall biosynthesis
MLRAAVPAYSDVAVIPNAVDVAAYGGVYGKPCFSTAIFSGALTYSANYDALRYLLTDVYPTIKRAVPEFVLRVTGRTVGVELGRLPSRSGVEYTGYLPDIRPLVAQSWMSLVPLRLGGGTRLKILEAMVLGTPVVSTAKGADGLDVTDGEDILVGDSPAAFASRAIDLLKSPELRSRLAAAGRRLVESKYDWRVVGRELNAVVETAATGRAA